jgi:hypothetical protein
MSTRNSSPYEKVENVNSLTTEERERLSDPNYKVTGKMEVKNKKTPHGSKSEVTTKDPEDRVYVIFIVSKIGEHYCSYIDSTNINVNGEFSLTKGRSDAYEYIKNILENDKEGNISIEDSMVLVEGTSCTNWISVYRFMKYCEKFFTDEYFNIEDYVDEDEKSSTSNLSNSHVAVSGNGFSISNIILNTNKK